MNKSTKFLLIIFGIVSIAVGIWSYVYESDPSNAYFATGIGAALIITVLSIQPKNKES